MVRFVAALAYYKVANVLAYREGENPAFVDDRIISPYPPTYASITLPCPPLHLLDEEEAIKVHTHLHLLTSLT